MSQPVEQPVSPSVCQPVSQSVNQPVHWSESPSVDKSVCPSVSHLVSNLVRQCQSANQSINGSINKLVNQSVSLFVNQFIIQVVFFFCSLISQSVCQSFITSCYIAGEWNNTIFMSSKKTPILSLHWLTKLTHLYSPLRTKNYKSRSTNISALTLRSYDCLGLSSSKLLTAKLSSELNA